MMQRDFRETVWYQEAEAMYLALRQPGTGQISDATELHVSPDGRHGIFSGTIGDQLDGAPPTRICSIDLESGATEVLSFGPHTDRLPRYSPDGAHVAFLSDRQGAGDFQLYLLDPANNASVCPAGVVGGWVEYLQWSPDGKRILLGVAGHGADLASAQGALATDHVVAGAASWMPSVESGAESYRWRRAWIFELATRSVHEVATPRTNIWEAAWCGNDALAAVVSAGPNEGDWYHAHLQIIDVGTGRSREMHVPSRQLGLPAASPSGRQLAIVEAVCSDRWIVAGDLLLIDTDSGEVRRVDTQGVDVTYVEWRTDQQMLVAGHRGFATVVGVYEVGAETFAPAWSSDELTCGGRYAAVAGLNASGDFAMVAESFMLAPQIAVVRDGRFRAVHSFALPGGDQINPIRSVDRLTWTAPDGLTIQGWLLRPEGEGPHPVVMNVHGGPVAHWRPTWLGRRGVPMLMLITRGYAVFLPNPRGSSGRGQEFAARVLADMGGADTHDYLSGLDHLVQLRICDRRRIGITGVSYGGFMASWLITQDTRFAAAVAVAPMTNFVSGYLLSNIPHFVTLFLGEGYADSAGKYFQRSPVMHASKVTTPTLNMCGALDRCAPPGEAQQFHSALLRNGVRSVLVMYPEEGHGVRGFPAAIDYAARLVAWFEEHLTVRNPLDASAAPR